MAALTTTYEAGLGWSARVNARNAGLLAQQALRRRGARTPEFYFPKSFDNSRLVKAPDPARIRQIRLFSAAIIDSLFADHALWIAALQRHRERLPGGVGEADSRAVARGESPVAPE